MTGHPGLQRGRRILLVEDEALIALDVQDGLEDAGYVVAGPAARLDRAVALASSEAIDAAVLDVNLAGVQVWPVAEILRQRGIPFLLVTGLSTGSGLPAFCARVPRLAKPFVRAALLDKLAEVLNSAKIPADHA
jgi:DNA-binding response OmpR family regulator